jgi:hypothetical protein
MRLDWILGVIGIWILSVVAAALSRVLSDECKAWMPSLAKWLIRRAVAWLPEDQRERYAEEWLSHINEIPGDISKIVAAMGFIWAAKRMPAETAKKRPIIIKLHGIPAPAVVDGVCRIELRAESRSAAVVSAKLDREP